MQPVVLRLAVAPRGRWEPASQPLVPRACTPLYPGYAAPLTDENIVKANAVSKMILQPAGFTRGAPGVTGNIPFSCSVNGRFLDVPDPAPLILPLGKSECEAGRGGGPHAPQAGMARPRPRPPLRVLPGWPGSPCLWSLASSLPGLALPCPQSSSGPTSR